MRQSYGIAPSTRQLAHPKYRPDIDGLRAVAVLSVVIFHGFPGILIGGFIGVDIFFVISGFLISTIIFSSLERNSFSFKSFYQRRIRRIFPALLVVLISCLAFGWFSLLSDEYKQLGKHTVASAGFVSNLVLWSESGYFDKLVETKPLLHIWSLGIEEQYYIMWPVLLWVAWQRKFNLLFVTIALAFASFGLNLATYRVDSVTNFYSPLTRFWELLAGSLLAYVTQHNFPSMNRVGLHLDRFLAIATFSHSEEKRWVTIKNVQGILGAFAIGSSFFLISSQKPFPGVWAILPVLGTVLIIAAGAQSWFNRVILSRPIMIWFGVISYPLYLWHWPLLSFSRIIEGELPTLPVRTIAVLSAIMLAWLTYKLVERPLRFSKQSNQSTIDLFLLMVLVGLMGYFAFENNGFSNRSIVKRNLSPNAIQHFEKNVAKPCDNPNVIKMGVKCNVYVANQTVGTILLWGDSTATVWLPVFLDVAKKRNYTVYSLEHPSCPPILGIRKTRFSLPASRTYCNPETMQKIFNFVVDMKPDSIFILSAWNSYSPYSNREFITDGEEEADNATTTRAIMSQVPYTLRKLSEVGRVVVFKAWPFFPGKPNYPVNRLPFLKTSKPIENLDFADFQRDSELINIVLEKVSTEVKLFDPAEKICNAKTCSPIYGETRVYADRYHISTAGAFLYRDEIENLILNK